MERSIALNHIFLLIVIWYLEHEGSFFFLFFRRHLATTMSPTSPFIVAPPPSWPTLIKIKHLSMVRLNKVNYFTWKAHLGIFARIWVAFVHWYCIPWHIRWHDGEDPFVAQQNRLPLAWLFSTISTFVLPQVTRCKTSFDVWVALQDIFNTKSKSRILQLKNQLQTFKKGDLTTNDYVAQLTTMIDKLHEVGIVVNNGELTLIALNRLDDSYEPLTAHTMRIDDLTFPTFLGLLRDYESHLQ